MRYEQKAALQDGNKARIYAAKKKYKYVHVHTLTYMKTDKDGNDDGKIYEYTGDHSSFCDGILPDDLIEVKDE